MPTGILAIYVTFGSADLCSLIACSACDVTGATFYVLIWETAVESTVNTAMLNEII